MSDIYAENHQKDPPELTDADFCPLCGVCLPPDERCNAPGFKDKICPHAEAYASQANL